MAEYLKLKKSNCRNCYKCIRNCPIKSIKFSAGQAHIVADECILCGQCFVVCPQNAKEIVSEVERVRVLLADGAPVYASLAPSFAANYPGVGIGAMDAALRKLGFAGAEETAVGAKPVKDAYERLLREEAPPLLISSCCHSINLLIQKYYPNELNYLAKVLSPMQAHGADIKRRHPDAKTVFIGPCVAKKDEADRYEGYMDAALTFDELSGWLRDEGATIETARDNERESRTRIFPTSGGVIKSMADRPEGYIYLAVDGVENCIEALKDIEAGGLRGCFIEMSACKGSCIGGPVIEKYRAAPVRGYMEICRYAGDRDFKINPMPAEEMRKSIEYLYRSNVVPSEAEIREILKKMGKTAPEHELNCGSCGYNACREKAIAVFQGKADLSMCLPFLKEKAESFSDNIINNTPNGILVINEDLEVQQINRAALNILNIRSASDVLGEQVVRILDPKDFMEVRQSGRGIYEKRVYLAEYRRYVDETVVLDGEYRVLICILRDVTHEEMERRKKEDIGKRTAQIADRVVERQMRVVQEIASLLGETTAETKIALTKLKESIKDE